MRRLLALSAAVAALAAAPAGAQTFEPWPAVSLGAMDKVTGRVSTFTVPVGGTLEFGTLRVVPRACRKTPPEETPESASFLEIDDERDGMRVFSGWMFASSPGVSALEHPVYDVWVLDCIDPGAAPSSSDSSE